MPATPLVLLAALATSVFWGVSPFLAKHVLAASPSADVFLFFTSVVTAVVFLALVAVQHRGRVGRPLADFARRVPWGAFGAWALLAYVLAPVLFYRLLMTDTPTFLVVLLTSLMPLVTVVVGAAFFREPVTAWQALGVGLVLAGIVVLQLPGPPLAVVRP
jgi:drug/metabolite transporter (DMT)-like permease